MSNRERIFESVLSIDAWHTEFDEEGVASVHVDVSFLRGKLGEEASSPVRFEIGLKRAEIRFVIPATEPLKVIQSSVKRETPIAVQSASTTEHASTGKLHGAASLDLAKPAANLNVSAAGGKSVSSKTTISAKQKTGSTTWAQSKTSDGHYRWEFAPTVAKFLLGKAWDAVSEPLLQVRKGASGKVPPICRVEVHCRREDLIFSNIKIKKESTIKRLITGEIFENKMAVIESYIRNALASRDLDVRNFQDPYGNVMLADVIVDDLK